MPVGSALKVRRGDLELLDVGRDLRRGGSRSGNEGGSGDERRRRGESYGKSCSLTVAGEGRAMRQFPRRAPNRLWAAWRPGGDPLRRSAGARSCWWRSPAALLAVVLFWPLAAHLGTDIPLDLGDPLPQSWQVAWDGHALATQPLDFFQSNQFWPLPRQPRVLRRADRLHAGRADRARAARGGRPLRPAVPVRVRARVPRGVPAGARARGAAVGRGRRGRRVRLRAVAARAGRAPARAVERRDPARAVPAAARLAAGAARG